MCPKVWELQDWTALKMGAWLDVDGKSGVVA